METKSQRCNRYISGALRFPSYNYDKRYSFGDLVVKLFKRVLQASDFENIARCAGSITRYPAKADQKHELWNRYNTISVWERAYFLISYFSSLKSKDEQNVFAVTRYRMEKEKQHHAKRNLLKTMTDNKETAILGCRTCAGTSSLLFEKLSLNKSETI